MVKLGSLVQDNITGFAGIAVARTHHLHGCIHISILPIVLNKDGTQRHSESLDEQRIVVAGVHPDFADYVERKVDPMLGYKVKFKVSGFTGIVGGYRERLMGADEVLVESDTLDDDGSIGPSYWTTVDAVTVLEAKAPPISPDTSVGKPGFNSRAL